ncbi:MAG: acyl-CoA dehydrogenase family protein, partial [Deltaproteobacteria bacterium]|nr:acyl-CoA dehydrogenase family protein [Deltaproteobacteria bacterium]
LDPAQLRDLERSGFDRDLWNDFVEMGVFALRRPEAGGGVGLGMAEAVLVFEELGRCLAPGPLLWTHLAADVVEGAGAGEVIVTGLELEQGGGGPIMIEHLASADDLLILREEGLYRVETGVLDAQAIDGPLDPFTPIHRVESLPEGERIADAATADRLRLAGTVLAAASMLGIAEASQSLATEYARGREQFGRAVGSFQAVKHILADCFVRQELARAAVYAAGVLLDDPSSSEGRRSASAAKLIAGEAAMKNARACIQVHGGMGFTWENPAHYYLKRTWILERAFGTITQQADHLAVEMAEETVAARA